MIDAPGAAAATGGQVAAFEMHEFTGLQDTDPLCEVSVSVRSVELVGKPAPAIELEDVTGKKVSLASLKGKAVLINFWATWCAPCKIETPWLVDLRNQYGPQGFEVLGISADDIDRNNAKRFGEEKDEIAEFTTKMHIPYPVLIDGSTLSDAYGGLDELPMSFYVDRNGVVVAAQMGLTSKSEIEGNIKKAMGM